MSRNRNVLGAALAIALVGSNGAEAATAVSGPIVNPANGHSYYLLSESSWQDAEAAAVSLGGTLVTIDNAEEQSWVFSTFGSLGGVNRSLWLGLSRADTSSPFRWADGTPVGYTNFLPGQPDSSSAGPELFVHMLKTGNGFGVAPGFWNDLRSPNIFFPQFDPIQGVAEIRPVPLPNSMSLVFSGLVTVCLAGRRRKNIRRRC